MIEYEEKMIPAVVGCHSLVGIYGEAPHAFGNYFDFSNGLRAVNMWSENLNDWVKKTNNTEIKVRVYENKFALVIDERLPKGYITNLCFTGCGCRIGGKLYRHLLEENHKLCGESFEGKFCGCETEDQIPSFPRYSYEREKITIEDAKSIFSEEYLQNFCEKENVDDYLKKFIEKNGQLIRNKRFKHCQYCQKGHELSSYIEKPLNLKIESKKDIVVINNNISKDTFNE